MKIAQVMYGIGNGGADIVALSLLYAHLKNGHEIDIISIDTPYINDILQNDAYQKLEDNKIQHYCLERKPKSVGLRSFIKLLNLLRKGKYDIVHSHLTLPDLYCGLIRTMGVGSFKHVITVHNTVLYYKKLFLNTILRNSTFVKCSPAIGQIGSVKKELVIPNGIDIRKFNPSNLKKLNLRSELGIEQDTILIISVGNLRKQKNQIVSLDTIYQLKNKHKIDNVHLLFVGRGQEYDLLQNHMQKLKISDRVHFLGLRNDVPSLLRNSDIFISSSKWEGLPLAVLEAYASGIVSVISPIHEHKVINEGIHDCYIPEKNDGQSFAEVIAVQIKENKFDHVTNYSRRNDFLNTYSLETFSKSYESLYYKLTSKK